MSVSMPRTSVVTAALWLLLAVCPRADVIDRILAVVAGQPIMLSDVHAALVFQLVQPPADGEPVTAVRDRLIERALMLTEVERYQPPEPPAAAIDDRVSAIERAAGSAAFEQRLAAVGFTREQLRLYVRDDLRIKTYLDERFGAAAQPSDAETLAYYRQHPTEFTTGGRLAPYDQVVAQLRAKLAGNQRATLIADWLASLRRRSDVTVLPLAR